MRTAKALTAAVLLLIGLIGSAQAANRIVIGSDANLRDCGLVTIGVSIENDVALSRVSLPLIIRAFPFNFDYPLESLSMSNPSGRLAGSMTGMRTLAWDNFGSSLPNRFTLFFESASPGSGCLSAGPLEEMVQLTLVMRPYLDLVSMFSIDTAFMSPGYAVEMLDCSGSPITLDQFTAGEIDFHETAPPIAQVDNDPVVVLAGTEAQNQIAIIDASIPPRPTYANLISGPGSIDGASLWTWQTSACDAGTYTVVIEFGWDVPGCGPGSQLFTTQFDVEVIPADPGDLNCDGISDSSDLNLLIQHLFFNGPLPPCP